MTLACKYLTFFSLLISLNIWSCDWKDEMRYVSLSGPFTHVLYNLGLLNKKNMYAISSYHGLTAKEFKGIILTGGLFIPSKDLAKLRKYFIFFDESREFKRMLTKGRVALKREIVTRGLNSFEVLNNLIDIIKPLTVNCSEQIKTLQNKFNKIAQGIGTVAPPILFYLGEVKADKRPPNLLMVNDGLVAYLIQNKKITTYPSDLAFVSWSEKRVKKMEQAKSLIKIGMVAESVSSSNDLYKTRFNYQKIDNVHIFNVFSSTLLIPGIPQIMFLRDLMTKLAENSIEIL